MRVPLTRHGLRELLGYGGGLLLVGVALFVWVHPLAAVPPWLLVVFVLSFFRDPQRTPPDEPGVAVAPADGKVTDIEEVDEPRFIRGRAKRIGIFLSVFDVHVNRAPLAGVITGIHYQPGKFLDARDPECKELNEANFVGFSGDHGPFAVRQVAGLIARRIVFPLEPGDRVALGQRTGMIKFGSRTELFVPAEANVEVRVRVGDKVKGARTVVLRYLD